MKQEHDYIHDIAEIRSMMERSSKFLSLSGWAGVMAGIYALLGAFVVWSSLSGGYINSFIPVGSDPYGYIIILGVSVLLLAIGTTIWLSAKKAKKKNEKLLNATSRRLLAAMGVPLVTGGLLILILLKYGAFIFLSPCSLIFYGLALYNAGNFTYKEVKTLGYIQVLLGLFSMLWFEYGIFC